MKYVEEIEVHGQNQSKQVARRQNHRADGELRRGQMKKGLLRGRQAAQRVDAHGQIGGQHIRIPAYMRPITARPAAPRAAIDTPHRAAAA